MSKGWWVKFIITLVITLMSVYTVLPTFLPDDPKPIKNEEGEEIKPDLPWYRSILRKDKVKLGLDLRGGLSLTLGVDTKKALETEAQVFIDDLKRLLTKDGIAFYLIERLPKSSMISVAIKDAKKKNDLMKFIRDKFGILEFVEEKGSNVFVFDLTADKKAQVEKFTIEQMLEQQRNRIDEFGVAEASIQLIGSNRILIQLPGEENSERAQQILQRVALLEFKKVDKSMQSSSIESQISNAVTSGKFDEFYSLEMVNEVLADQIPKGREINWEDKTDNSTGESSRIFYLLESNTILTGKYLDDARVGYDRFNKPAVDIKFNPGGAEIFKNFTTDNVDEQLAILLDNKVNSAPAINQPIPDGRAQITFGGMMNRDAALKEAQDLSAVLRAGSLPAPVEVLESRVVGPSLGKDSIDKGSKSVIIGLILVVIFMLFYYGIGGFFADIALTLNLLFIMAMMVAIDATMTLPGIAGMALSLGMAIDANVIINERIREELRRGKPLRNAVSIGFKRSLLTILDANVTTLIAAFILLQYGTGPVKGFAVTLMIGLVISFYTAFAIVRTMFEFYLEKFKKSEKMYI